MSQIKRVERAITSLVLDQPFFAVLAMRLALRESAEIKTFATNGRELVINPGYCGTLSDGEVLSTVAHEVLHCAMGHVWRVPPGADMRKWNIATDQEVNDVLIQANALAEKAGKARPFPMPDGYLYKDAWKDWAAERIYRSLPEDPENDAGSDGDGGKGSRPGQQNNPAGGEDQQGMGEVLPDRAADPAKNKQDWERAVVQAAEAAKGRGDTPGFARRLVEEITRPKQSWKSILRDFLRDVCADDWSWAKTNRRYLDSGFSLPVLHSERSGKIVFAVDTSGSIGHEILREFIAEAQGALDELSPRELIVVECDAEVGRVSVYEPGDTVRSDVSGGGGTDFRPVFSLVEKDEAPDAVVYLTDLEGSFPEVAPEYPVLWATPAKKGTAPFGEIVRL